MAHLCALLLPTSACVACGLQTRQQASRLRSRLPRPLAPCHEPSAPRSPSPRPCPPSNSSGRGSIEWPTCAPSFSPQAPAWPAACKRDSERHVSDRASRAPSRPATSRARPVRPRLAPARLATRTGAVLLSGPPARPPSGHESLRAPPPASAQSNTIKRVITSASRALSRALACQVRPNRPYPTPPQPTGTLPTPANPQRDASRPLLKEHLLVTACRTPAAYPLHEVELHLH